MWASNWTKGLAEALEKTGEVIAQEGKRATQGLTEALEKTGDAITHAATIVKPRAEGDQVESTAESTCTAKSPPMDSTNNTTDSTGTTNHATVNVNVLKNLQMGWSSVIEGTKQAVEATKEAVELERSRLEQTFLRKGFYKRDPKLPLDAEALRDAEVVYITDRIITMSHPAMASSVNPNITAERKLAAVGQLLQRRHDGRFLVWNLSEVEYDISILDDQVMTFSFPGSPSPPLGLLLKLLVSMENWMKADDRNVAVVHCLTGKGRTSTVLAAFLCWMGEAGFGDINQALDYIAKCKKVPTNDLTIPSQRRYASYFKNMLDNVRPSQPPLLLKRIIMSEAPKFAKGPPRENMEQLDDPKLMGCAPYLQIFKGGKLIYTTAATLRVHQPDEELPFVQVVDGTIPFNVEQVIQGDILIRCRHLTFNKQRVSMFRAAFHTGYVPPNVLRLTKAQLDGACTDKRFPDDFFLDLIFEKVDAETATKHLEAQEIHDNADDVDDADTSTKKDATKGPVVKAANNDAMLQGDSRFWDIIASRREEQSFKNKKDDPFWGPTVGRRREAGKQKTKQATAAPKEKSLLGSFSIGNEFDFLAVEPTIVAIPPITKPVEKDMLMEALDALDHDEAETEEVIFDHPTADNQNKVMEQKQPPPPPTSQVPDSSYVDPANAVVTTTTDNPTTPAETPTEATPVASRTSSTLDDDMDALLAAADEDLGDINLEDFDEDDDLGDLEAMLQS